MQTARSRDSTVLEHWGKSGKTVVQVRGSLIASSQQTLRDQKLFERYAELLPPGQRETVLFVSASNWYPIDIAMTHYGVCDALALNELQIKQIGEIVSERIMGTYLGTILRTGRNVDAGTSPWIPLKYYDRLWDRILDGGGCTVKERSTKDAIVESRGVPMFRYRYFREAYVGLVRNAVTLFCKKCYAQNFEIDTSDQDALGMSISWV
jgi:hypothetical protein